MSSPENKPQGILAHPIFLIGVVDFGIQAFWILIPRLVPGWYRFFAFPFVQLITSSLILILCAIFVKDKGHRSILIVLMLALAVLRISAQLLSGML